MLKDKRINLIDLITPSRSTLSEEDEHTSGIFQTPKAIFEFDEAESANPTAPWSFSVFELATGEEPANTEIEPEIDILSIDEESFSELFARFSNRSLREKVEYTLYTALNKISETLSDLVAEVHATEDFLEGEITGQFNLLVIIKPEVYSVIKVILHLADTIFGSLFLRTGILFGLTIMSEQEWNEAHSSEEFKASDTIGNTVVLLIIDTIGNELLETTTLLGETSATANQRLVETFEALPLAA